MSSPDRSLFRQARNRTQSSPPKRIKSTLVWVGLAIWCAPYIVLGTLRYGLGHEDIGQPLSWFFALIGLQLFASIAVVRNVWVNRSLAVMAILVYALYFLGVVPGFTAVDSILPQLCIMALMAISLWLPFASGQLSLAQGGFMAVGAYGSAWLTMQFHWPFLPALLVSSVGVALFGFIVSYPALRLKGVYLAVATLGLGEVIRIFFTNFEPTGGAFGLAGIPKYTQTWQLLLAVAAICAILYFMTRGRIGRAIWAVRNDSITAMALGINITHIRILTFTCGAFIAGLAGGFQAHYVQFITSDDFGLSAMIDWLTIVMVGGFETFFGLLAATAVLGTLPELMRFLSEWRLLLNGAILVVFLILRPNGIITRELLGWRLSPATGPQQKGNAKTLSIRKISTIELISNSKRTAMPVAEGSTHSNTTLLLKVNGVSKRFGGITALSEVSLDVRPGEIHGLIGPNGAGKTTLFNIITGFTSLDSGSIHLGHQPVDNLRPQEMVREGIARTFQNIRLFGGLSALENVMLGAYIQPHRQKGRWPWLNPHNDRSTAKQALELLNLLGLAEYAERPASSLSYGDQRRLEIARALASEPKILLLDEPAAGMNATEAAALGHLLRQLCQSLGKTILIVEHDMELVMGLCDRITVLNYGKRIASGTPSQIQNNPDVIAAYLGTAKNDNQEVADKERAAQQLSGGRAPAFTGRILPTNNASMSDEAASSRTNAPSKGHESLPGKELLSIHNLITQYGNIQGIKGISIHVNEGEIVALIGANGAGKSTTLLSVSGVLAPTSGTIHFDEQNISGLSSHQIARCGIAQVVEGRAILTELTVLENLKLGAYIRSDRDAIEQDMNNMFDRFPRLRERSGQVAGNLSGGEQQMLAIARALMSRPKMLLLDEPSMGLAPLIVKEIFNLLRELNDQGLTLLIVEQNAAQALEIAGRAYVLASGTIVRNGSSTDLLADKQLSETYLGAAR